MAEFPRDETWLSPMGVFYGDKDGYYWKVDCAWLSEFMLDWNHKQNLKALEGFYLRWDGEVPKDLQEQILDEGLEDEK